MAFGPVLLADINQAPAGYPVTGAEIGELNGIAYFRGAPAYSDGLWRTDGTTDGTWQVCETAPTEFHRIGNTLFFASLDDERGAELWKSDGTAAGTVLIKFFYNGIGRSAPTQLTSIGNTLYFVANDGTHGIELWKSDGTEDGTVLVKDVYPGFSSSRPLRLTNLGGTLVFTAISNGAGRELWKSDGTETGTALIKEIFPGSSTALDESKEPLINVSGTLFFEATHSAYGKELWKSDGTEQGTALVKEILPGANNGSHLREFTSLSGKLFFTHEQLNGIPALWQSDGTEAGTIPVPGLTSTPGAYDLLSSASGHIYFKDSASQLWRTNGTAASVTKFDTPSMAVTLLADVLGQVFFEDADGRLWKTDGTEGGTQMLQAVRDPSRSSSISAVRVIGNLLYFAAPYEGGQTDLWVTDGAAAGTRRIAQPGPSTGSAFDFSSSVLTTSGQAALFTAFASDQGRELWRTDGTTAGTALVKDIFPGPRSSAPSLPVYVNGRVFFAADDGIHGRELWLSDGTAEGTRLVADLLAGPAGSGPTLLTNVGGTLFFLAERTPGIEYALYKTDGTPEGTVHLDSFSLSPAQFAAVNGTLFFQARSIAGTELWRSDGTPEGTVMVKDINPGTADSFPSGLVNLGGQLYFSASSASTGNELWKSDGTGAGTVVAAHLTPGPQSTIIDEVIKIDETLYVRARGLTSVGQIWKSDGTSQGTQPIPNTQTGFTALDIENVNGTLFYTASNSLGMELWKIDPTSGQSVLVKDVLAGPASSSPLSLTNINGLLYFLAKSSEGDRGLWRSDGTSQGTWRVYDTPMASFSPRGLTLVNDRLLLVADDGIHGRELYALQYFNAPPTFSIGATVQARDIDGQRTINAWATAISPGAPDEFAQQVTFEAIADRPELFLEQPRIDSSGNLSFHPKPNARGLATISVTLHDDGGTAAGGSAVSPQQRFTIQIVKPNPWHNAALPLDVLPDGSIVAGDVLQIVNYINAFGAGPIPDTAAIGPLFYDVIADNQITAGDALAVINQINAFGPGPMTTASAEGEGKVTSLAASWPSADLDFLTLLASDHAGQAKRRFKGT